MYKKDTRSFFRCTFFVIVLVFGRLFMACHTGGQPVSPAKPENHACSDTWVFKGNISARKLNDTVEQQIVDGKLWFEIISPLKQADGRTRAYIRNYRMDGSLESEGYAVYEEHPAADYTEVGTWKRYDCKGKLRKP